MNFRSATLAFALVASARAAVARPPADVGIPSADERSASAPKTPGEAALDALNAPRGVRSSGGSRALSVVETPVNPEALFNEHCTAGYIDCENGFVRGTDTTCKAECEKTNDRDAGNDCCTNYAGRGPHDQCDGFTGKICKSGRSCSGLQACKNANITYVINGCVGGGACEEVGHTTISPDPEEHIIMNSCIGVFLTCKKAGWDGSWKSIINSCYDDAFTQWDNPNNYRLICYGAGWSGRVGDMIGSCLGDQSCQYLGYGGSTASGSVAGDIINSCRGRRSCLANGNKLVTYFQNGVEGCCNSDEECCDPGGECSTNNIGEPLSATCIPDPITNAPTSSPTSSPVSSGPGSDATDSSASAPWEITHLRLSTNFSTSSEEEISTEYLIGKDRQAEAFLFAKDCQTNITDISINTTKVRVNQNSTHDVLSVRLGVDKSAIGNSSAYNKTTNEFEVCQVTRLVLPASASGGNGALTITEHLLQIAVAFDLSANFNFTAGLEAGEIFNETEAVDAAAAVDAFKCDESFNPNDDALGPNDRMFTCVGSKDTTAFEIEEIESMTISQTGKQQDLEVIVGGKAQIPSITTIAYTPKGAIIGSRIPINLFDFAEGKFLKITGAVTMKLAGGTSRRLDVEFGSAVRDLQEETNEASYAVDVALHAAEESAVDLSNSAAGVAVAALEGFAIAAFYLLL